MPASLLTAMVWAVTQMGGFEVVGPYEYWADWLPVTTPRVVYGFIPSVRALFRECVRPRPRPPAWFYVFANTISLGTSLLFFFANTNPHSFANTAFETLSNMCA